MTRGGHILYQDIAEPLIGVAETTSVDKWYKDHQLPILRKTLSSAILAGSFFFQYPVSAQETVTVDKWYQPIQQPYFDRKKFYHTGEFRFEVPRTILLSDWYRPLSEPYFTKRRNYFTGEFRFEVPRDILISDWFQPTQQPRIVKDRNYFTGNTLVEFSVPGVETITVDKWFMPTQQPRIVKLRNSNFGEYRFEVPRTILLSDWYQPISQPYNRIIRLNSSLYVFEQRPAEIVTVDKWYSPIIQPYIKLRQTSGSITQQPFIEPFDWITEVVQHINRKRQPLYPGEQKFELPVVPFDWLLSQPEQLRKQPNRIFNGEFRTDFISEEITIDKWFYPISQPYFDKKRWYFTGSIFVQIVKPVTPYYPFECKDGSVIFVKQSEAVTIIEKNCSPNTTIYESE